MSEGFDVKDTDWIVIDLEVARIHIFSPQGRIDYGLEEKFNSLSREADVDPDKLVKKFAESTPRKVAGDPSLRYTNDPKYNPFL